MKRMCPALALLFGLGGCAQSINEGLNRLSSHPAPAPAVDSIRPNGQIYFDNATLQGTGAVIDKGDNISITIMSAFICDFREGLFGLFFDKTNRNAAPCRDGIGGDGAIQGQDPATRGEIAILASVKTPSGETIVPADGASQYNFGRVVFYNEDIRETGQLLNNVNIPIHGPIKYDKGQLELRLAVIEFDDAEVARAKELLSNLASIGGTAYPPSSPILGVLNQLGQTIIATNKNDVELAFKMTIDSPSKLSKVHRAPLREGYYAVIRHENRSEDAPWMAAAGTPPFVICPKVGRLMKPGCEKEYRDQTWILLRVSREDADVAAAQNTGRAIAEFLKGRQIRAGADVKSLSAGFGRLKDAICEFSDDADECKK